MLSHYTPALPADELITVYEAERRYILQVLELCKHQRARAARILGIDRKTLYRRLLTYGVFVTDAAP